MAEVSRYLKVPRSTIRYWVVGSDPLIRVHGTGCRLSFNNLVEAHVLRALRTEKGLMLDAVRSAIRYAEEDRGLTDLLRRQDLRTDGRDVFLDRYAQLLNLSQSGQYAMRELLKDHLSWVEYDVDHLPLKLFPARNSMIEIDPAISCGFPTVSGTGISTRALVRRMDEGDTPEVLAEDYGLKEQQIRAAIRYEKAA